MKKKVFGVIAIAIITTAIFAGCTHSFTCGLCGKSVNESGHKYEILGQEVEICDDCYNGLKSLTE